MTEQRVVVKSHLGIEGHETAVLGEHERIDLKQRRIERHKGLRQRTEELFSRPPAGGGQAELCGEHPRLVAAEAAVRIEGLGEDQLRCLGSDLFNVHAAGGARDQYW